MRNFFECGCWCGVTLVCAVASYEKSLQFPGGFAFTMVEPQKIFANPTIAANGREIKVSTNWFCIITLFSSKKS